MSITPIEIASMTPKSAEVSATRQGEVAKAQHSQASLTAQFNNDIKQNSMQTVRMSETENPEFRYDAKNKGRNLFYNQQGKKKKKQQTEVKEDKKTFTGGFDIRI